MDRDFTIGETVYIPARVTSISQTDKGVKLSVGITVLDTYFPQTFKYTHLVLPEMVIRTPEDHQPKRSWWKRGVK